MKDQKNKTRSFKGKASYYGSEMGKGARTASGEIFNPNALTAAHKTLPFNSRVKVTNLKNGKSVIVKINDRGPFTKGRVIDVSRQAAKQLGFISQGIATVQCTVV